MNNQYQNIASPYVQNENSHKEEFNQKSQQLKNLLHNSSQIVPNSQGNSYSGGNLSDLTNILKQKNSIGMSSDIAPSQKNQQIIAELFIDIRKKLDDYLRKVLPLDEDKETIQRTDTVALVHFIKQIVQYLTKTKLEIEEQLDKYNDNECGDYETMLQKLEAEVRQHIRIEQQLKLYAESTQEKLDEILKQKDAKEGKFDEMQKKLEELKKECQSKDTEIESLRNELKHKSELNKWYEDQLKVQKSQSNTKREHGSGQNTQENGSQCGRNSSKEQKRNKRSISSTNHDRDSSAVATKLDFSDIERSLITQLENNFDRVRVCTNPDEVKQGKQNRPGDHQNQGERSQIQSDKGIGSSSLRPDTINHQISSINQQQNIIYDALKETSNLISNQGRDVYSNSQQTNRERQQKTYNHNSNGYLMMGEQSTKCINPCKSQLGLPQQKLQQLDRVKLSNQGIDPVQQYSQQLQHQQQQHSRQSRQKSTSQYKSKQYEYQTLDSERTRQLCRKLTEMQSLQTLQQTHDLNGRSLNPDKSARDNYYSSFVPNILRTQAVSATSTFVNAQKSSAINSSNTVEPSTSNQKIKNNGRARNYTQQGSPHPAQRSQSLDSQKENSQKKKQVENVNTINSNALIKSNVIINSCGQTNKSRQDNIKQ